MSPKQVRAQMGSAKRRRPYDEDDISDSELSEIEDDIDTPAEATAQDDDDDDDDDDQEEDEDEDVEDEVEEEESSDPETPEGEVEESYISDDPADSDDDEDSDMKAKPSAKAVAQRAVTRGAVSGRRASAIKPRSATTKKPKATKKVGNREETALPPQRLRQLPQRTRSSATIGTRSSSQQQGSAKGKRSTPSENPATRSGAPTIKLKIGKDRLRQATSSWTPPPDSGRSTPASAAAAALRSAVTSTPRGRKIVQEESDEDQDMDEEESKMDEEEQPDPDDDLGDEDAEGETDDELMDSDDDGEVTGTDFQSRTGTPDRSRLTNRQRTRLGDITTADLLELPSGYEKPGANKGVTLSAHEQELKRAEMARRRKNLTDQKLEEEKMDTINRLLKKQTPKMRTKGRATGDATPADQMDTVMGDAPPPPPTMVRWVSNKDGFRLAVPDTWLAGPLGTQFQPQRETERMKDARRTLVEEL